MTELKMKGGKAERVNTKCLDGMKCPKCGYIDSFVISSTCYATWEDDGSGDYEEIDFDNNSWCLCSECGYSEEVWHFIEEKN